MGDARRLLMRERRRLGSPERTDDSGQDHGQAVASRVDHARLAQHRQQVGPAIDRLLADLERPLDDLGDDRVLLGGGGILG